MKKVYYRLHQLIFRIGMYFLKWRKPILIQGPNAILDVAEILKERNVLRVLIVTDKQIVNLGLLKEFIQCLESDEIAYAIYDKTVANPTTTNIREALQMYSFNNSQGIIAFGGGSSIDCAKGVAALIARPNKTLRKMSGNMRVRRKTPPLFAVPTTAGTGSETTIASVITDADTHEKFVINDVVLIPDYAVLDPLLTVGLPKSVTAMTGMDALTHAIESYLSKTRTTQTIKDSKEAIKLIFKNIEEAYNNGENVSARMNMLMGSFYAGRAFTRAYVGYVHSIAHAIGGKYNLPHGLVIAATLPRVLEAYGDSVNKPLSELNRINFKGPIIQSCKDSEVFIEKIRYLNDTMGIPATIKEIKVSDIPKLAKMATKEANPLYPVPKILNEKEIESIIEKLIDKGE